MSACRYVQGKCFGLRMRGISPCEDGSCPGPKGGEFTTPTGQTDITKPAAPETREEVKTMAAGQAAPVGICEKCEAEEEKLYKSKSHLGLYCKKCNKAAMNKAFNAKRGGAPKATKATVAAKAPPPSKPAAAIAKPRPTQPSSAPVQAPSSGGLRLTFSVTIRPGMTPLEIMDLMRAVPSTAVVEG